MANIVSATFTDRDDAERAVNWLRERGVPEDATTIVGRGEDGGGMGDRGPKDEGNEAASGALTGAGVGAAVGALFGLAAFAIPGVGPFIAAGALANVLGAAGGAAVSGALVGATAGGLAGALSRMGLGEEEARHYAGEIERGNVYVAIDLDRANIDRQTVIDAFRRFNGRMMGDTGTMAGDTTRATDMDRRNMGADTIGAAGGAMGAGGAMAGTGTTGMTSDAADYTGTGIRDRDPSMGGPGGRMDTQPGAFVEEVVIVEEVDVDEDDQARYTTRPTGTGRDQTL